MSSPAPLHRLAALAALLLGLLLSFGLPASAGAAPLTGSVYDSGDGDQEDPPDLDWKSAVAAGLVSVAPDEVANDDCFGIGSKENEPDDWQFQPSAGGCTPGKSDVLVAFANSETTATGAFLHAGFQRNDVTGNSFIAFELNQITDTWVNANGETIPCRSNGDLVVTYSLGGSSLDVDVGSWTGTGTTSSIAQGCPNGAKGSFDQAKASEVAGLFQGTINTVDVTNYIEPGTYGSTFIAGSFAESALNLPEILSNMSLDSCFNFFQVSVKTRTSGSISSSLIEYVPPIGLQFSNCSISGQVYNDLDNNGARDAGEGGVEGTTVFIDLDNDCVLDPGEESTTTSPTGEYAFGPLVGGTYRICIVPGPDAGAVCTDPDPCVQVVDLVTNNSIGNDFGIHTPAGDLEITKALGDGNPIPGELITYELNVTNNGPGGSSGVTVSDQLPANLIFDSVAVTLGPGSCTENDSGSDPGLVECDLGDIPNGASRTVEITARVVSDPGAQIANTATVDSVSEDPDPDNNTATDTTDTTRPEIGAADKTVSGDPDGDDLRDTQPGDDYTFSIAVTNDGTSPAYDVTVTDTPDTSALENFSVATDAAWTVVDSDPGDGDGLEWLIPGPINPGDTVTVTYTADLVGGASLSQDQSVANTAEISGYFGTSSADRTADPSSEYPTYTDAASDTVTMTVNVPALDFAKTTTAGSDASVGDPFGWTITITNNSEATAYGVDISDTLPADWDYDASSAQITGTGTLTPGGQIDPAITPNAAGDELAWADIADLAPGESVEINFTSTPQTESTLTTGTGATNPHTNTASAGFDDGSGSDSSASGAYGSGPDTADAFVAPLEADLVMSKDLISGKPIAGQLITYELFLTNNGPDDATGVEVSDQLPANLIYVSHDVTGGPGSCVENDSGSDPGLVECEFGIVRDGQSRSVEITARVVSDPGAKLVNTATATTSSIDPDPDNNSATETVSTDRPEIGAADKTVSGDPDGDDLRDTQPGDDYTFSIAVTNDGTSPAYDVTVTDTPDTSALENFSVATDAAWTVVDSDPGDGDGLEWLIPGPINPGDTVTVTYTADLVGGASLSQDQSVANTAEISGYFGTSEADRTADPSSEYPTYTDAASDTVTMTVNVPALDFAKTTTASTFPDTATATVGDPFGWRIVITNNSEATAYGVDISDTLPPDWDYEANSAVFTPPGSPTGQIEPTITADPSGDTLEWNNVTDLAPGDSLVLRFDATPTTESTLTTGTGATNPHTNTASAGFDDGSGSDSSASGAYGSGPDSANAIVSELQADLDITKDLIKGEPIAGQLITYEVVITNNGPDDATGVEVSDQLPANLIYVSHDVTGGPGSCTENDSGTDPGLVECEFNTVPNGETRKFTITARVKENPGSELVNSATAASISNDPTPDNTATDTTDTTRPEIGAADKTVSGDPDGDDLRDTQPGDDYTFSIAVTNDGTSPAYDVTVTDTPDTSALENFSVATDAAWTVVDSDPGDGDGLEWLIPGPINPGDTVTVTYTADLVGGASLSQDQSVANTAEISGYFGTSEADRTADPSSEYPTYTDAASDTVTMTVNVPALDFAKTTTAAGFPDTADADVNQPFSWRIVITNNSEATANDIDVSDTLPPDWEYEANSAVFTPPGSPTGQIEPVITDGGAGGSDELNWTDDADLAPGESVTLTFDATPTADAAVTSGTGPDNPHTNTAGAGFDDGSGSDSSASGAYGSGPDTASAILVTPEADLEMAKTLKSGKPIAGQLITYTVTVTNNGPQVALEVEVSDQLPANLIFDSFDVDPGDGTCSESTGLVECDFGNIPNGESRSFDITARVKSAPGDRITNTASGESTSVPPTIDPTPENEATLVLDTTRPEIGAADKTVSGDPDGDDLRDTQPGDDYTFSIAVTNDGTSPAYDVTVTDTPDTSALENFSVATDAAWTVVDSDPGDGDGLEWLIPGPINPGDTVTVTYTADLVGGASLSQDQSVANTAEISGYFGTSEADRTADPSSEYPTYTDAASDTVTMTVNVPALDFAKTTTASTFPDTATATVGDPFGWRIVITNNSEATAYGVDISDTLPPDWDYEANSAVFTPPGSPTGQIEPTITADPSGDTLEWNNVTDLAPGDSLVLRFDATPTTESTLTTGTGATNPHTNTASAGFDDGSGSDSSASGAYGSGPDSANAIVSELQADLDITKDLIKGEPIAGQLITYEVVITNNGPDDATGVEVSDQLPANLIYVSHDVTGGPGSCTENDSGTDPGLVECEFNTVPNGETRKFTITARVKENPGSELVNSATAASISNDPTPDNTATDTTDVKRPQIVVDKQVNGDPDGDGLRNTDPGDSYTFSIVVENTGTSTAYDVAVSDALDDELTNVALAAGDSTDFNTDDTPPLMTWLIPTIGPGEKVTLSYTADLVNGATLSQNQEVTNSADSDSYFGASPDDRQADPKFPWPEYDDVDPDGVTMTVKVPSLEMSKTTGAAGFPNQADAGIEKKFKWRIVITNPNRGSTLVGVDLTDTLPKNWTYEPGSAQITGSGSLTPAGQVEPVIATAPSGDVLTWENLADLGGRENVIIEFEARPDLEAAFAPGVERIHTNSAKATGEDPSGGTESADGPYRDSDNARAYVLRPVSDLAVTKVPSDDAPVAGTEMAWTIEVANGGPDKAPSVAVSDAIPAGLTYIDAAPSQGSCDDPKGGVLVCELGPLGSGKTATIVITTLVEADQAGETIINSATAIDEIASDPDPDNNEGIGEIEPIGEADLAIAKELLTELRPGIVGTYELTVTNDGPSVAEAAVVTDTLPPELSFRESRPPICSDTGGGVIECVLGDLPPGAVEVIEIDVDVVGGGNVTNTATVASETDDPDQSNNTDERTDLASNADLSINKTGPTAFVEGVTRGYTLLVTNESLSTPSGGKVTVTDQVPDRLEIVSASGPGWNCSISGQLVTCTRSDSLAPGDSFPLISIRARARDGLGFVVITNTGAVDLVGDLNLDNNSDSVETPAGNQKDVRDNFIEGDCFGGSLTLSPAFVWVGDSERVRVFVEDETGSAVAKVPVLLKGKRSAKGFKETSKTNKRGIAVFEVGAERRSDRWVASVKPCKLKAKLEAKRQQSCRNVTVKPRSVPVGVRSRIRIKLTAPNGDPLDRVRVKVNGLGNRASTKTNAKGKAKLFLTPTGAGLITVRAPRATTCEVKIGAVGGTGDGDQLTG